MPKGNTPLTDRIAIDSLNQNTRPHVNDTIPVLANDTLQQRVDTFSLKLSKDTLDAPVNYEAEDSAVVLVSDKKILLYGKTKTTHKDITLLAPKVEMDQQTNILTAVGEKDSTGATITRAHFEQGTNKFDLDTVVFNFKTQKGITKNAFTQQEEMFVQGETIKKINNSTFFVSRGRFTTCNLDEPHFAFRANKLKVINNKVAVSGPTHPEFEDVPIPIYLPFGYYPLSRGRHSGLLQPNFTVNEQFGLGLEGLGYYKVLNDYLDVTLRGNIYSYGGWSANITPTYRKRYRYQGSFNLNIQHTKFNFKGDPDYNLVKTFMINWNHSIDQRSRPGTNFSASVNAGSTRHNQYIPNNPNRNFQNQLSSSISYSKTWTGKPYNFTMSANHNQNNNSRLVNLILPDAGFTVNTIYPLQRKEIVGTQKWYEKIGIGYNGVVRNQLSFYDTGHIHLKDIIDTLQWGAQHRIPISLSLPPLGPFIVSPSISYEEKWLAQTFRRTWNNSAKKIDTAIRKGIFTDRQLSFGFGFNTSVYGTFNFHSKRLMAIRHVMRPSISFNYKPDLSKRHHYTEQIDTLGTRYRFSEFDGTLFGGYPEGRFGGISFGVDNNLEMKWRSKKDTGAAAIKKVRLIDGFGFNSGYNFIADSFKLQPVQMYLRSTLFEKVNLTAQASLDPYQVNNRGFTVDRFVWQDGRFSAGRLTSGSISLSTDFRSKPKDPKKEEQKSPVRQIDDPTLAADQEQLMDYMRRNPAEFVDFNIPWSVNLSFSMYFTRRFKQDYSGFETDFNANLTFNNSFSLTPKWNFSTNGYYDFQTMKLQTFTMSINREMHCWQMSIGVTPIGQYRYFNISISPKSSILQDLRVNRTRYFYNY
ncbi:MAG: LPS-assembly protein LptD [Bacteroidota bacterium]|nr:LPS-assembly protein LptD [Bacteroidota bacterium]